MIFILKFIFAQNYKFDEQFSLLLLFISAKNLVGYGQYLCLHNVLKAHARAYHIYHDEFKNKQQGKIGVVIPCTTPFPKNKGDILSADIAYEFDCGWAANPIFSKSGDYPEIMKARIAENSKFEGLTTSRLPEFSKYWIDYIRFFFIH